MPTISNIIKAFTPNNLSDYLAGKISSFKPIVEDMSQYIPDKQFATFSLLERIGEAALGDSDELLVFTCRYEGELSSRSSKKLQYDIARKMLKEQWKDAAIFVFYDEQGRFRFSFIRTNYIGTKRDYSSWKRFTYFVDPAKPNKTFRNQIDKCSFASIESILKAFSIDAVSDEFYNEFKPEFQKIADYVVGEADFSIKQDFALLFVIRLIFLGFVQKREWLGNNIEFLQSFWNEYKAQFMEKDLFYKKWMEPLLFEALNSPPGQKIQYQNNAFSKDTERALQMAPYLNGELFKRKAKIDTLGLFIPDAIVNDFIGFLFQYNFTIEENTRFDEDLELNPEFLGIIFERIVNKENGAVYTPRTEVDFMCRISLVKWLQKVSHADTNDLYYLFFREKGFGEAFEDAQKEGDFSKEELRELIELLKKVTICDPSSGSGAFPVGMMQVLAEILENLQTREKTPDEYKKEDAFDRKKDIIANSLFGVEVKQWAVWINQLRL